MKVNFPIKSAVLLLAVLLASADSRAQVLYGSLVGNVTDATGGAIPGAEVTVTHQGTNQSRHSVTNEVGTYEFPTIPTGNYTIKVIMPGFKEFVRTNVPVTLNNLTRADVSLEVGEVTETLTVTAETTLLQTDRAEVRAEIPEKALKDLPTPLGRNYQYLFNMLPGFRTPTDAHSVPANPSRALTTNVNGTTASSNDVRIDGASNYYIWLPHITAYIPTLESIQTVNVVTNSFDAEQGLAGGAAINVQIKSGSNELHGSLFEFHGSNATMTRPYFLPVGRRNPKFINNEFGGTLGGRIKRDRLFFFVSYEGSLQRSFAAAFATVPTLAQRRGDLSASDRPIYDPLTGKADGSGREAFVNKIVPSNRIDPTAQKILDHLIPLPTFNDVEVQNFFRTDRAVFDRHRLDTKVDLVVTQKFNMYGRFSVLDATIISPPIFGNELSGPAMTFSFSGTGGGPAYSTTLAGTYVLTPSFVLDVNFGYTRQENFGEQPRLDEKLGLDFLGIAGANGPRRFEGGWPSIVISGFTRFGYENCICRPFFFKDPQRQIAGNVNWTRGKHSVRFGGEAYFQHMNHTQPEFIGGVHPASGGFTFAGGITTVRGGPSSNRYNAMGAFLLGLPSNLGRILQVPEVYTTRTSMYSTYIRDRWAITPKLTMSIGTRWEYFPMPTRADRGIEVYDFLNNKMKVCGVGVVPKDCDVRISKTMFAPRLGLAYRVTDDFVIRAGYGLSNEPFSLARPHRTNHPLLLAVNVVGRNSFSPAGSLAEGLPSIPPPDLGNGIIDVPPHVGINSVGSEFDRGYIQSWNLTLQKKLPWDFVGDVAYVATREIRKPGFLDLNAGMILGAGRAGQPYFKAFGRTARTTIFTAVGHSRYDSLQAQLNRRFANGVQIHTNYTWSKSMGIAGVTNSDNAPAIKIPEFYHLNRGLTSIHVPHRLNFAAIFELPFGGGKRWLTQGAPGAILGGWQFNTLLYVHSGTPFSVTASGTSLNAAANSQRADQVKPEVKILGGTGPGQSWFDPLAFKPVTEPRFGTAGFNILRGPAQFNMDFGVFRKFRLTENVEAQFRAEAFNFTNTPHFANPGTNVSAMLLNKDGTIRSLSGYTEIRGTRNSGREFIDQRMWRFGLRIVF